MIFKSKYVNISFFLSSNRDFFDWGYAHCKNEEKNDKKI